MMTKKNGKWQHFFYRLELVLSPAVFNTCDTSPGTGGQGSCLAQTFFPPSSISYCIIPQLSTDAHSEGVLLLCSIMNLESGTPKSGVFFPAGV